MERTSHKADDILAKLKTNSPFVLTLNPGDDAWNPVSTNRWNTLRGPAEVTYHRFPDGGIKASINPLKIAIELRDATVKHFLATGDRAEPQDLAALLDVSESTIRKRLRTLDHQVDGCDVRMGVNGRHKTNLTPTKMYLRSLLLHGRMK